jgi:transcriptional regulator with AAA-type ATPase domain/tetratricopeptide (TPR) repeat protein
VNTLAELIGESAPMAAVRSNVQRLLGRRSDGRRMPPVLLLGETGSGKGLLAKLLHRGCGRTGALIELNCAAIPETMLEAELFGHERGAFTDAREARRGLFQAAQGGTLFLDEIGLMSLTLQGKLLKVIEDQSVRRLGSTRAEPVDVWIISATSEDLSVRSREGRFREDLYHRLAVISFSMPPLRERGADVVMLAERLLATACQDYGLPRKRLSPAAETALRAYSWPGNVRELANVMERVVLLFDGPVVSAEALAIPRDVPGDEVADDEPEETPGSVSERRRTELLGALQATAWNITHTSRRLGLSRNTVKARMRRYGLSSETAAAGGIAAEAGQRPGVVAPLEAKPAAVVWESRRLTVLRVEITQPDGAARWGIDEVFGAVVAKVAMFGGRVEDVSPRTATVVFGLEVLDDAVRRAANAALAVLRMLRERNGGATVALAIHVAELLVARMAGGPAIDAHSKREAEAVLEVLAGHGAANTVVVSGAAARFLSRRFELVSVTPNRPPAGPIFRLAGRERSGFVPFSDGGNFVGRQYDLEVAQRRLGLAESGQGQVFAIVGEPGIGKSRLLYEFRRTLRDRGCRVLDAACPSHGAAFAFLPIVDIVRALFDLDDVDDARTVREAVTRATEKFSLALAGDNLSATLALLDALPADDPFRQLTPAQRRQRVEEAVCQLILGESARQPLVLIVEDLHWIDSDSRAVLDALVDRLSEAPILLVVTHRPEHRSGWTRKTFYVQASLEPLTPASVHTVLDELLGDNELLRPLKDAIVSRTDGNPFFVEETVRTLIESGTIVGEPGAYALASRVDAIQVPPTVQAVLAERMDRLGVEGMRLLQAAVVVGGGSVNDLAEVVDLPAPSFRRALDQLHQARFLYEAGGAEDPTIAFPHSLVQEVAYASLPADHRRALHLRCLTVLESSSGVAPDDDAEQAAHHAFHGEAWERASRYSQRAAAKAVARSAYRAAVSALNQALVAIDKLPPTRETLALAIDARFDLRNMLWALSELFQGLAVLQDAVPLAEALGDQRRLARVLLHTSYNYWVLGDNERALTMGRQAVELANRLDDFAIRIDCNQLLGLLHHSLGDYPETAVCLERVIDELARSGRQGRFAAYYNVHARTWLAWALAELGELDRAAALAEEAVATAEISRDVHNTVAAHWGRGLVEVARGEVKRAIPLLRQAHDTAQYAEIALWARPTAAVLGRALALAGIVDEGRRYLEFAVKGGENNVAVPAWQTYLAEACLLSGDLGAAQRLIERALQLAEKRKERGFLAHAHRVAAEVARGSGHLAAARRHYETAIALASALGMSPLVGHCELGLGSD